MEFDANEQAVRESGRFDVDQAAQHAGGLFQWLYGVRSRTREATDATQRHATEARNTAGVYIHRYPFATVTFALVVGFAAGVLVARR